MSTFALKLIAMVCMVTDHTALALYCSGVLTNNGVYMLLRSIGRPAFPIFCYLLAVGYEKTSNREKYLSRLCVFAVISQLPFCLVAIESNYSRAAVLCLSLRPEVLLLIIPIAVYFVYVCGKKFRPSLISVTAALLISALDFSACGFTLFSHENLNVFYTLAVSLVCMRVFDMLFSENAGTAKTLAYLASAAVLIAVIQPFDDYSYDGLILALMLHFFRGSKKKSVIFCAAWCAGLYFLGAFLAGENPVYYVMMCAFSMLAPLMLAFYNEKRGPKLRTAFYLVYPVHLALIALVFVILR